MTRELHSLRNATVGALAVVLAIALAPDSAHAKVYFTAFLGEGGLQSEPAGFEDGLALDVAGGKMYWTDTSASVISSANLNGSEKSIVLDDFGQEPIGIALDVGGGKMYWTDREGVKRANLNGTEAELLTGEPARGFLALDLAAQRMYWADWPSGNVKTAAMSRGAPVTNLVTKQPAPFGIAVDHAGGKLYWLELDLNKKKRETNAIRSANLDGTGVTTLIERPGAGFEGGLVVDPAAGKLYWGEAEAHDIAVSNLDGSQVQTLLGTGEALPEGLAVETVDPRPTNTARPLIEGNPQVGSPLRCNPGAWAGIGEVLFGFQWGTAGGPVLEGATGSGYVPSFEDAGTNLLCAVTASDNVETGAATSAPVRVAGFPSAPATPRARLIAGIAFSRLRGSRGRARVPVFTSLPAIATIRATRIFGSAGPGKGRRSARRHTSGTRTASQRLASGRGMITLRRLAPGATYRLALTVRSTDGQIARDSATLKIARR